MRITTEGLSDCVATLQIGPGKLRFASLASS